MGESIATRTRMTRETRRQAILSQTAVMVSERGYHGFSLNELARRCDLTSAGLLHHFESKEAVLVALLQERDRLDAEAVSATLPPVDDQTPCSRETCLACLRAVVVRNAGQPAIVRLYAILRAEALVPDHPAFAFFRSREMAILESFRHMIAAIAPDPLATARQIMALMNGLETQWLRESRSFDLVAEWDSAIAKILT